ncbi:MAG: superoxide dismutase [Sporolactobacillus sp.]|jgi:Fe-Mn family superoxide dismutase|nr:superoxide dismutase [Sporolactobacillus sp.]
MTTLAGYKLPDLPYNFDALEPYIDEKTMRLHHGRHHATYVANLNATLEAYPALAKQPIEALLSDLSQVPESKLIDIRKQGGGHANHSLFWKSLSPHGGGRPQGKLAEAIDRSFGSFASFKDQFTRSALRLFGSGWTWLVMDDKSLAVMNTANQDSPLFSGKYPLIGIDLWEHAYYLKYQNRRADYIRAFFHVVNWDEAFRRLSSLKKT